MAHVLTSIALLLATTAPQPRQSVTFIVSAKGHARARSSAQIRRIFLGQISRWEDGHRIMLIMRPTASAEGRLFLERLIRMSDIDYAHFWIGAVFRGEASAAPRVIDSRDLAVKAVADNVDAIGFVLDGEALPESVAVLAVAGKLPSDPDNPIPY